MTTEHHSQDPPRLSDLCHSLPIDRVDTKVLSLVRGTGDDLLTTWDLNHEVLLVPMRPMHFSAVLVDSNEELELRLCPYTLCLLHGGYAYDFNYVRCDDLLVIGIESDWMADVQDRCLDVTVDVSQPIDTLLHPDIPPMIHAFQRHMSFPECPNEPYLTMLTELLVARFFWHRQREGQTSMPPLGLTNGKLHGVLLSIEDQLDRRILVTSLARSVSMSASRFSRAFKRTIGVSPQRYILERRVLRVQDLLEQSTLSLADVALEAGFSSQAHMTAMFARHFGVTPGEYRKHVAQQPDEAPAVEA